MNRLILLVVTVTVQLGEKPWCYVLPNTQANCHALDKADCDGKPARYCIYDSKEACEAGKLYSDETCEENKR